MTVGIYRIRPEAVADLDGYADYIAEDNSDAADRLSPRENGWGPKDYPLFSSSLSGCQINFHRLQE